LFIVRCDMKTNQVVIDKELKVSMEITKIHYPIESEINL